MPGMPSFLERKTAASALFSKISLLLKYSWALFVNLIISCTIGFE